MKALYTAGFPIYQIATARAADPNYFKMLHSTQPGITKAIAGHLIADQVNEVSHMIVRRSHREPHTIMQSQRTGALYNRHRPRTVYKAVGHDFVVVRQMWSNGAAEELGVYSSAKEARAALKKLTGRGPHSGWFTQKPLEADEYGRTGRIRPDWLDK